jgi:hypothetical protein
VTVGKASGAIVRLPWTIDVLASSSARFVGDAVGDSGISRGRLAYLNRSYREPKPDTSTRSL